MAIAALYLEPTGRFVPGGLHCLGAADRESACHGQPIVETFSTVISDPRPGSGAG
jgi:hypothetical protein